MQYNKRCVFFGEFFSSRVFRVRIIRIRRICFYPMKFFPVFSRFNAIDMVSLHQNYEAFSIHSHTNTTKKSNLAATMTGQIIWKLEVTSAVRRLREDLLDLCKSEHEKHKHCDYYEGKCELFVWRLLVTARYSINSRIFFQR